MVTATLSDQDRPVTPSGGVPGKGQEGRWSRPPKTHVFLQVESGIVHQSLHHPHEVDEERQVVLHHVDTDLAQSGGGTVTRATPLLETHLYHLPPLGTHPLRDEGAEARKHLVETGIGGDALQSFLVCGEHGDVTPKGQGDTPSDVGEVGDMAGGGQGPIKRVLRMEGEQEAWGRQPKRSLLIWGHLDVPKKGAGDPQDVGGHRGEVEGLGGDRDTLTARLASQEPTQASVISL